MDEDKFLDWQQHNFEDLMQKFVDLKEFKDKFDEFCFNQYQEAEADHADYLYEMHKDMQLEESNLKEE